MEYWDIEDYLEEIKYLLTEYEEMTEEVILDWEDRAREYILKHISGEDLSFRYSEEEIDK